MKEEIWPAKRKFGLQGEGGGPHCTPIEVTFNGTVAEYLSVFRILLNKRKEKSTPMKRGEVVLIEGMQGGENRRGENAILIVEMDRWDISEHETNLLDLMEDTARDRKWKALVGVKLKWEITKDGDTERVARDRKEATGILR